MQVAAEEIGVGVHRRFQIAEFKHAGGGDVGRRTVVRDCFLGMVMTRVGSTYPNHKVRVRVRVRVMGSTYPWPSVAFAIASFVN